jgi:hypothetical protein
MSAEKWKISTLTLCRAYSSHCKGCAGFPSDTIRLCCAQRMIGRPMSHINGYYHFTPSPLGYSDFDGSHQKKMRNNMLYNVCKIFFY